MSAAAPKVSGVYETAAFAAGFLILVVEVAGTRFLAPEFGGGVWVWSVMIAVTLLSLALGAAAGGWFCDRSPDEKTMGWIWAASSAALVATLFLAESLRDVFQGIGFFPALVLKCLFLFVPPLFFLSAVAPFCVKLQKPGEALGRVVGRVSAAGTAGSCAGALLTGLWLIPSFSVSAVFLFCAASCALGAAIFWIRAEVWKKLSLFFWCLGWGLFLFLMHRAFLEPYVSRAVLWRAQSLEGEVLVVQAGTRRHLLLDGIHQGGVDQATQRSATPYTDALFALGRGIRPAPKKVLVVGLGAGLVPSAFAGEAQVDVAEINPQVVEAARRWFNLDSRVNVHLEDGRRFWRRGGEYDLIFLDAFQGEQIPAHLLTVEALREAREALAPRGALFVNMVGHWEEPFDFPARVVWQTLRRVFRSVEVFGVEEGALNNVYFVASDKEGELFPGDGKSDGLLQKLLSARRTAALARRPAPAILTDAYHPLEFWSRKVQVLWREESRKALALLQ